ncbi:MAG: nucleotide exchange factor GrpE [Muribaculaceae bacterium]|nr:nucleotide exchange factor GrpE [Muribaculaceae bacterium]
MSKFKHNRAEEPRDIDFEEKLAEAEFDATEAEEAALDADAPAAEDEPLQRIEALRKQLDEANQAIEKEKKEYLFLMADFDNFRKRALKEKSEILRNGAEKVLAGLLPIVDDFERGLDATASTDNAEAVREGMELIYNKLVKYLADNGVKAMDSTGADFDADLHEAIANVPSPDAEMKGKVVDTVQKGYMINDKVLRHAKVAVGA